MRESIRPLPTEEEYYAQARAVSRLMTTPASIGRATRFVHFAATYNERMHALGTVMSPHDRLATMAFSTGSMAGVVLARMTHGAMIDGVDMAIAADKQQLSTFHFEEGSSRRAHLVTAEVAQLAVQGLTALGEQTRRVVGSWSEQTMPDESMKKRFSCGLGFSALLACYVHNRVLREDLQERVEQAHDFDWDAALRRLM